MARSITGTGHRTMTKPARQVWAVQRVDQVEASVDFSPALEIFMGEKSCTRSLQNLLSETFSRCLWAGERARRTLGRVR